MYSKLHKCIFIRYYSNTYIKKIFGCLIFVKVVFISCVREHGNLSNLIRPQSVVDKLQFQAVILVFITSNFIVSRFFVSCKAKNVLLGLFFILFFYMVLFF